MPCLPPREYTRKGRVYQVYQWNKVFYYNTVYKYICPIYPIIFIFTYLINILFHLVHLV